MAFEYSESVYGVRTYGSSVGEVINASASTTATSSIANVNWVVAIGADASMTSTASITCSGEVVVIEDTSEFDYGTGLYGANQFGIENLQTIVSATSSIANVTCERIRLATGIVAAESAIVTIGGFTANASGTITVTSATTVSAEKIRPTSATVTSASSVTANATCTFNFTIPIAVTSTTTCAAEEFFLESSDKMVYGHGLYGMEVYDQADLQTIVSATSVGTTASCERILATTTATSSAVATITASGRRVPEGSVIIDGTSTTTVTTTGNGSRVRTSGGTATPEATIASAGQIVGERSATVTAVASNTVSAVTVVAADATLTATATIAAVCNRVRFGSGVPTAVASITVLGFATRGGIASTTSLGAYTITYEVGHQDVGGNHKYFISEVGTQVQQPTLVLVEGNTYVFNYPSAHPFKFSTTSDGTHGGGSEYTTGVTHNSSTQVTIVVPADAPTLYYYCGSHSGMGGTANTPSNLAEAVVTSDSEKIFQGNTVLEAEASFLASGFGTIVSSGIVSSTSVTTTIGREKWEIIVNDTNTWTQIAA